MFARSLVSRVARPVAAAARATGPASAVRCFGANAGAAASNAAASGDVVVAEIMDSLEWVLDSPFPVHQFDESPIIVEIEHLDIIKQKFPKH